MLQLIKKIVSSTKYYRWNRRLKNKINIVDRVTLVEKFSNKIILYSNEEEFNITFPKHQFYWQGNSEELQQILTYFSTHPIKIPQPFYVTLENSLLIGNMAVAVNGNDIILESTNNSIHYLNKTGDAKYLQRIKDIPSSNSNVQKAVSLVNILCNNYYHWVIDIFPIIEPLYDELLHNENFKIILRKNAAAFQYQYLELIGLSRNILKWNSLNMHLKELVISSNRNVFLKKETFQSDLISRNSIDWIRECISNNLSNESLTTYDNIYLSRNKSEGRKIANEDELSDILERYGIKKIFLEDYSIEYQIRLFQNAKRIIGPHGAGFTNILFSKQLHILEFIPTGSSFFSSFHQISSYLNHYYIQIELNALNKNGDMEIEAEVFEEYLKLVF